MIDSILIKIKNNNFDFTDEGLKVIKENDDLGKEFVDSINRLYDSLVLNKKDTTSYDNLIKYMAKNDLMSDLVYNSLNNNAMFPLILDAIDNNFCDYEAIISLINEQKLDSNLSEKLINYYYESIKKKNYEEVDIYSQKSLEILLELKRYDLIEKAKIKTNLSDELIDKLFEIFGEKIINIDFEKLNSELDFNNIIQIIIDKIYAEENYYKYLLMISKAPMYTLDVFCDYELLFETIPNEYKKLISNRILDAINSNNVFIDITPEFFNDSNNFPFFLNISEKIIDHIIKAALHDESLIKETNEESLELIFNTFLKNTSLNKKHLVQLKEKVGYKIIIYLENKNIENLINLDDLNFEKVMNLFSDKEYQLNELEGLYDAIKQKEFGIRNPQLITIFHDILTSISENTVNYLTLTEVLESVMDDGFYIYFNRIYKEKFSYEEIKPKELLKLITEKIKNGTYEEKEYYTNVLHDITNYYLDRKRGEYKKNYNMYKDFNITYNYDEKNLHNAIVEYLLKNNFLEFKYENQTISFYDALIKEMSLVGIEKELAIETILFYKTGKINNSRFNDGQIKSNIKQMKLLANKLSGMLSSFQVAVFASRLDADNKLRRIYQLTEENKESELLKILSEINIDLIKDKILINDNIYNSLLNILKKYRPHLLPSDVLNYIQNSPVNLQYNYQDLAQYIMYYAHLYEKSNTENSSLYDLLVTASSYTTNNIGSAILDEENYKLIKSNPGPNSAQSSTTADRLKESVKRTIQNFRRNQVAVPTFNEVINLENGKKIRVVVGNFTHPCNLTHGERTGACMRIGGAGESLYKFCLDNPFGFHIRFENPETGEYISRVSGFRNGNSVFLNELRNSCNSLEYLNDDVVNACKIVADMIIEKSKESTVPIDNVCISKQYAMNDTDYNFMNLGVENIKTGFCNFYSDVSSTCIVLAASAKDKEFVPVNFDNSNVDMYLPAREVVEQITDAKIASQRINRVNLVKKSLENEYIDNEKIIPLYDVVYCLTNQDWYIYVDSEYNIHEQLIVYDKRALIEFAQAKMKIESLIAETKNQNETMDKQR